MSVQPPTCIPRQFSVGDTLIFSEQFAEISPNDGTAVLWLSLNGGTPTSYAATTSGNSFLWTISATATTALLTGNYEYSIIFTTTSGGIVSTPKKGVIYALPNYAIAQTPTQAQQMVALLQGALAVLATTTQSKVNFAGQEFELADIEKYQKQLVFWMAQVKNEQDAVNVRRGGHDPGRILTRFDPAGWCGPYGYNGGVPYGGCGY